MSEHALLSNAVIYLSAAVVTVPLAKKLGLGSVLGYLLAGIAIGPFGMRLIKDAEVILHFSEFGVVLLLFLIGLELSPKTLWSLRKPIFVSGSLQLSLTALILFLIFTAFGFDWKLALIGGLALGLSSTAIALQILQEKNLFTTHAGNNSFSILLFQDMAVIPMMALLPLLILSGGTSEATDSNIWFSSFKAIGMIAGIILVGHYALRPILRIIASTGVHEIFTAFALLLVIGIALLMDAVGLSMALGAFIAGLLLEDSEYRHALEVVITPMKGLLMGLFFIAIGMSISFTILLEKPLLILGLIASLVVVKMVVLYTLAIYAKIPTQQRWFFSFLLAQGGEFAFVLFSLAISQGVIQKEATDVFILVVALSMMTTPLLMLLNDKWIEPRYSKVSKPQDEEFNIDETKVIVAGFGRFGQIVGRLLHANNIPVTLLDHDSDHIEKTRLHGFKVFFGDVTRLDLLHAAGASKAEVLVISIDDPEKTIEMLEICKKYFPHLKIVARAEDLAHVFQYMNHGIDKIYRETFYSALYAGEEVLRHLGFNAVSVHRSAERFRKHDEELITKMYQVQGEGAVAMANACIEMRNEFNNSFDDEMYEKDRHSLSKKNKV